MKAEILMDFHKKKHEMGVSKSKASLRPSLSEKLQPRVPVIQNLARSANPIQLCHLLLHPTLSSQQTEQPVHQGINQYPPKHPESDTEDRDEISNLEGSEEDCSNFQILDAYPEGGGGPNQHLPDHPFGHWHKFEVSRIVTHKNVNTQN